MKVEELKTALNVQQVVFTKPSSKSNAAIITSFKIEKSLPKKKSLEDSKLVKECLLAAADLFDYFKNNSEMLSVLNNVHLPVNTA